LKHIRGYIPAHDQRCYARSMIALRITGVHGLHRSLTTEAFGSRNRSPPCQPCAGPQATLRRIYC
jgi:hypothetical protein